MSRPPRPEGGEHPRRPKASRRRDPTRAPRVEARRPWRPRQRPQPKRGERAVRRPPVARCAREGHCEAPWAQKITAERLQERERLREPGDSQRNGSERRVPSKKDLGGRGNPPGSQRRGRPADERGRIRCDGTGQKQQSTERGAGVGRQGDVEIDGASNAEGDDGEQALTDGGEERERPNGGTEAWNADERGKRIIFFFLKGNRAPRERKEAGIMPSAVRGAASPWFTGAGSDLLVVK